MNVNPYTHMVQQPIRIYGYIRVRYVYSCIPYAYMVWNMRAVHNTRHHMNQRWTRMMAQTVTLMSSLQNSGSDEEQELSDLGDSDDELVNQ